MKSFDKMIYVRKINKNWELECNWIIFFTKNKFRFGQKKDVHQNYYQYWVKKFEQ